MNLRSFAFRESRGKSYTESRLKARVGDGDLVIETRTWCAVGSDSDLFALRAALMSKSFDDLAWGQSKTISWPPTGIIATGTETVNNGNITGSTPQSQEGRYGSMLLTSQNAETGSHSGGRKLGFRMQIRTWITGFQVQERSVYTPVSSGFVQLVSREDEFAQWFEGNFLAPYEIPVPSAFPMPTAANAGTKIVRNYLATRQDFNGDPNALCPSPHAWELMWVPPYFVPGLTLLNKPGPTPI